MKESSPAKASATITCSHTNEWNHLLFTTAFYGAEIVLAPFLKSVLRQQFPEGGTAVKAGIEITRIPASSGRPNFMENRLPRSSRILQVLKRVLKENGKEEQASLFSPIDGRNRQIITFYPHLAVIIN